MDCEIALVALLGQRHHEHLLVVTLVSAPPVVLELWNDHRFGYGFSLDSSWKLLISANRKFCLL
jgi:hypothetical protein